MALRLKLRLATGAFVGALTRLADRIRAVSGDALMQTNRKARNIISADIPERKQMEQKLADYQTRLRMLAFELTLAEDRTRRQVAMELHDLIGQSLSMAKLQLQKAVAAMGAAPSSSDLTNAIALVDQAIQNSRALIFDLCPPMLADLGLEATLEWLTRQFAEKHGLQVEFHDDQSHKVLSEALAMFLFRATRELLTNVVKHAGAREAVVSIWKDEEHVHIAVEDNGAGCNQAMAAGNFDRAQGRFGLFSIRERLALIGGHLEFQSRPNAGTRVEIAIHRGDVGFCFAPLIDKSKIERYTDAARNSDRS